jgi:hypothetical protein
MTRSLTLSYFALNEIHRATPEVCCGAYVFDAATARVTPGFETCGM